LVYKFLVLAFTRSGMHRMFL